MPGYGPPIPMTLTRLSLLVLTLSSLTLTACPGEGEEEGGDASATAGADCSAPVPTFTQLAPVFAKCTNCHASTKMDADRMGAPVGYDFDVYDSAVAEAEEARELVENDAMPPAPNPKLTAEEKEMLYKWVECGTPE